MVHTKAALLDNGMTHVYQVLRDLGVQLRPMPEILGATVESLISSGHLARPPKHADSKL